LNSFANFVYSVGPSSSLPLDALSAVFFALSDAYFASSAARAVL
jgi:hypothetical protein